MTLQWINDAPNSLGGVRWLGDHSGQLGIFAEKTTAECQANLYNQDVCYGICSTVGIGGWSAIFVWPCVNQCMIEGCGAGILVSHTQMQKVGTQISPCFNACMDAFQQETFGTDEAALRAAAQECAQKCGVAQVTKSTPGGTKVTKPAAGGAAPKPTPGAPSPPSTAAAPRPSGAGGLLVAGLAVAAIAGIAAVAGASR